MGIDPAAPSFWTQASATEVDTVMAAAAALSGYLAPAGYLAAVESAAGTASVDLFALAT